MKKNFLLLIFFSSVLVTQAQNLGIGVNPPTQKLDVLGNVQFSGALMPNNLSGNVNDVLTSSGIANTPPTWSDVTSGQSWTTVYSTDSINVNYTNGATYVAMPGLSQTITVPAIGTFDAFIYTDGGIQWTGQTAADNNGIQIEMSLRYDNVAKRYTQQVLDNTGNFGSGLRNWSFCYVVQNITAGSHTFAVYGNVRSWSTGSKTVTFCDPNVVGKARLGSLSVCLIRK